jgi:hypothetical protein
VFRKIAIGSSEAISLIKRMKMRRKKCLTNLDSINSPKPREKWPPEAYSCDIHFSNAQSMHD